MVVLAALGSNPGPAVLTHARLSARAASAAPRSATSAGQKEQEALNHLEKRFKGTSGSDLSYDDTVQAAIAALQTVLSEDFKPSDIEVAVVSTEGGRDGTFKVLPDAEVEEHLTAISEKD